MNYMFFRLFLFHMYSRLLPFLLWRLYDKLNMYIYLGRIYVDIFYMFFFFYFYPYNRLTCCCSCYFLRLSSCALFFPNYVIVLCYLVNVEVSRSLYPDLQLA